MKMQFYSVESPAGSAVELARAIASAAGLGASEAMRLAMELFGGLYQYENPLELELIEEEKIAELMRVCKNCSVSIKA